MSLSQLAALFISQAKRKGIGNPFPFMAVADFLPSWAVEVIVEPNEDADGSKRLSAQRLDMVRWLAAFDAMSMAMDAAEVWYG